MALNYQQTKAASAASADLEALTGLNPTEETIVANCVSGLAPFGSKVMIVTCTDLGWSIVPPA